MGLLNTLGLTMPSSGALPGSVGAASGKDGKTSALQQWRTARTEVVTLLRGLAQEAAAENDTESAKAVLETNAVIKQLSGDPATEQQVQEMKRWLVDDDVVSDVCALDRDIRQPLLAALAAVEASL